MALEEVTRKLMTAETEARIASLGLLVKTTAATSKQISEDNARLRFVLLEAKLAIEFLHEKYGPTGYSNTAIAQIEKVLSPERG